MDTEKIFRGEERLTGQPYGPGKFDNDVDEYFYSLNDHDDQVSVSDCGDGWFGLAIFNSHDLVALEHLPDYKDDIGAIVFERSDGIVHVTYYDDREKLDKDWGEICVRFDGYTE